MVLGAAGHGGPGGSEPDPAGPGVRAEGAAPGPTRRGPGSGEDAAPWLQGLRRRAGPRGSERSRKPLNTASKRARRPRSHRKSPTSRVTEARDVIRAAHVALRRHARLPLSVVARRRASVGGPWWGRRVFRDRGEGGDGGMAATPREFFYF